MRQEAFIWDRVSKRSFTIHLIVIVGLFYNCIYLFVSNIVIIISILLLQMCCFGNPNMVTQIVSKLSTTYINPIKANTGLTRQQYQRDKKCNARSGRVERFC